MEEAVKIKTVLLDKFKYGIDMEYRVEASEFVQDMMIAKLRAHVWASDVGKKVEISYPSNWWQAVKDRWFPKWAKRLSPVIYTTKTFEVKATYPDLAVIDGHSPILKLSYSEFENARVV